MSFHNCKSNPLEAIVVSYDIVVASVRSPCGAAGDDQQHHVLCHARGYGYRGYRYHGTGAGDAESAVAQRAVAQRVGTQRIVPERSVTPEVRDDRDGAGWTASGLDRTGLQE
jgi:hypothetical protein